MHSLTHTPKSGYNGIRISFKFMQCPACGALVDHWWLRDLTRPLLQLRNNVSAQDASGRIYVHAQHHYARADKIQ